jgi:hypothetical protein
MISGMHAIIYSRDVAADRTFFRDVLGFPCVDAGDGWLIFAAPPSELAFADRHPARAAKAARGRQRGMTHARTDVCRRGWCAQRELNPRVGPMKEPASDPVSCARPSERTVTIPESERRVVWTNVALAAPEERSCYLGRMTLSRARVGTLR